MIARQAISQRRRLRPMAKKKKKRPAPVVSPESPASIAVTVSWMLAVMTTLVCSAMALLVWLVVRERADNAVGLMFAGYLHFAAVATAFVSLALLPAVYKVRRDPPPTSIVLFALLAAALPIVAALF
jgi:hypothetical protein